MKCKCTHEDIIHWRIKSSKRSCHFEDCECQKFEVVEDTKHEHLYSIST